MKQENLVATLSFEFSLQIISLYKLLVANREFVVSKQLLRSATGIGANVEEACAAFSRKDFAFKMSIASKEARECHYWLRLLDKSQMVVLDYQAYLQKNEALVNLLTRIVKTTQQKLPKQEE